MISPGSAGGDRGDAVPSRGISSVHADHQLAIAGIDFRGEVPKFEAQVDARDGHPTVAGVDHRVDEISQPKRAVGRHPNLERSESEPRATEPWIAPCAARPHGSDRGLERSFRSLAGWALRPSLQSLWL